MPIPHKERALLRLRNRHFVAYFLDGQKDDAYALRRQDIRLKCSKVDIIHVAGLSEEEILLIANGEVKERSKAA